MSRCRETSGVLFKHPCRADAETTCVGCNKPICASHGRPFERGQVCVTCVRAQLKNPAMRGSYGHLRDDPYFYWYYRPTHFLSDPYGRDDYALFDRDEPGDFGAGVDDAWQGS
jgi:hypothetical protein